MAGALHRAHVLYRGIVQGVGFRWTVRDLARPRPVTGWVRNLPDGRVELVAEGPREDVESLLGAVRDRMAACIEQEELEWGEATGGFEDFAIRR